MERDPLWTRCPHLSAGTCPEVMLDSGNFFATAATRPELNQDLALVRLAAACRGCALAPPEVDS